MSESSPITEQAHPETKLARDRCSPEDLPHDALQTIPRTEPVVQVLEQINAELENLPVGAGRTQVEEEEDVVNDSGRLVQPDAGGSSSGGLKRIPSITRGFPFPVSYLKPVGKAFEDNRNVIWSWLMDDEISTIGIYGMGGIGKTTMLQHIQDELLRRPDISHHVYWVTLSRDFSIHKLQNLIAKHLDLDLSREYDIPLRAVKLFKELMKKQEWILILDDLWESFELSTVGIPIPLGIPVPLKGCKVIFTTRSDVICQRMGCQVITKVSPLSKREAWTLFMETLGHGKALSPEVERIAVDIARECAGLPLGIITMAGSLRGVDDQDEWRRTLKILKELKFGYKGDEVFRLLRFSYDRLDDFKLQQCLLYCALFPEDYIMKREDLIYYLIDEGIIQEMWSREAAFNKGHAMLDRLENAGLLQRIDGGRDVKMHDLVRDMAKGQRRKSIEMAGSNIKSFWNHVEKMINGIMKYIENTGEGSVQHVDRSVPPTIDENYNRREAAERLAQPAVGASSFGVGNVIWSWLTDDEVSTMYLDMENTGEGSVQHVDRIVPPTIDENYNRREATEILVQPGVGASSFGVYGNHNAISTSQQEQNNDVDNVAGDAATTMGHAHLDNGTGGVVQPGAGASSFGGLTGNTNETPGDPSQPTNDQLCSPSANNDVTVNVAQNVGGVRTEPVVQQSNAELDNLSVDAGRTQVGVQGMEQGGDRIAISTSQQEQNKDELKKGSKYRDMVDYFKSGWPLLLTNLFLEIASAVFDQLGYAFVGMVLAFVALLLSTAELIYMERMAFVALLLSTAERMSLLPSSLRPSTTTFVPGKPAGTIVEYFGLASAVWQCVYSTVAYAYARQKKENPIKMSLLPFVFLLCVVISKLNEKSHIDKSS